MTFHGLSLLTCIDVRTPFVTVLSYPMSMLEFIAVLSGLITVWLTARERMLCWPTAIINAVLFAVVFYQVRLYSDMFLQGYFIATSIYGWWRWRHPRRDESANSSGELAPSFGSMRLRIIIIAAILFGTALWGTLMSRIHLMLPTLFPEPAAFPYADGAVAVMSVTAQFLLTKKKIESWILWIAVDALCVALYLMKHITLMSIEYGIFLIIAAAGLFGWMRSYRSAARTARQVVQ